MRDPVQNFHISCRSYKYYGNNSCLWLANQTKSSLKPFGQTNWYLVGNTYGIICIGFLKTKWQVIDTGSVHCGDNHLGFMIKYIIQLSFMYSLNVLNFLNFSDDLYWMIIPYGSMINYMYAMDFQSTTKYKHTGPNNPTNVSFQVFLWFHILNIVSSHRNQC